MVLQQCEGEAVLQIHTDGLICDNVNLHQGAVGVVNHHVALQAAAERTEGQKEVLTLDSHIKSYFAANLI